MAAEGVESIDFWDVLDDAELTVERWPAWQQRYDADVYYEDDAPPAAYPFAVRRAYS